MTLRLDFPFTQNDSPALRARIHRDLDHVWRSIQEADPRACALVLTGGFSRGEGSAIGSRPLNDYDLVVVRDAPWPPAQELYEAITRRVEDALAFHVDLLPVWRERLRVAGRKAFWFDTKHGGRVIAGDPDVLDLIPVEDARRLGKGEAPRLLANRTVGLLEALPGPDRAPDALKVRVQSAKAILAVVEGALILEGRYAPTLRERLDRFQRVGKTLPGNAEYLAAAEWATRFKLDPDGPAATLAPDEAWTRARTVLLAFARDALPRAGWGSFDTYPDGAPFDVLEWAWASVRARQPAPPDASHAVRARGFRLLEAMEWPGTRRAEASRITGLPVSEPWPAPLVALQEQRSRTLH